jgi:alkanesulfonate monooxygenase SsuD/methylene tetrahydromethanopterin reductase-like flavin-dependent oxidoreductase (luciferase family)
MSRHEAAGIVTACRRGVALTPMETRREVIVRAAVLADQLGYEVFSVPEGWGLDSGPVLTEIALRTGRIRLVSGVLSVWGRTPATLAMTAATLHQVCGGRYVLGLGVSTRALAEGFHDSPFEHPAGKLRDVVTNVRALLAGQPAQLSRATAARPLSLGQPAVPELPIWVAALGRHTIRVAAELGDGWIPALVARDRLPAWAVQLRQLREAAAPHARPLTIAAGPITAVDEDPAVARDVAAACTAWYLSAMGNVYARSVSGQGYAAQVQAIIAANPRPSPRRGTVPADAQAVLDQLAAYGTADQVREQLRPWHHAADIVTIGLPPGMPWHTIEATLHAAAPSAADRPVGSGGAEMASMTTESALLGRPAWGTLAPCPRGTVPSMSAAFSVRLSSSRRAPAATAVNSPVSSGARCRTAPPPRPSRCSATPASRFSPMARCAATASWPGCSSRRAGRFPSATT